MAVVALKTTGCYVWQLGCQANNVTAGVHGYFQSFSTLISRIIPHAVLKFSHVATSRHRNSSVSRTGTRYTRSYCSVPQMRTFFTARCYASAVVAMDLCLSVSLSVTSRSSTKTAKRRITQTTPHDSPGILIFWCRRSPRNSTGVTPYGAPNADGVGQNRRLLTNNQLYLENSKR